MKESKMHRHIFKIVLFVFFMQDVAICYEINPVLKNPDFDFLFDKACDLSENYLGRNAAKKIISSHHKDFYPKISEKLKSGKNIEKQVALQVLGNTSYIVYEKDLVDTLTDDNFFVKQNAAQALYNIFLSLGKEEIIERIEKYCDADDGIVEFVIPALICAFAENQYQLDQRQVEVILKYLDSPHTDTFKAMLNLISKQKSTEIKSMAFKNIKELLKSEKDFMRRADIAGIMFVFDTDAVPVLRIMVSEDNAFVQSAASYSLAKIGDNAALDTLHRALELDNVSLKIKVLGYLAELKNPFSEKFLVQSLDDSNWYVRKSAAKALGNLQGKAITPGLRDLLKDNDLRVSSEAAIALKKQGALGIEWRIINDLSSNDKRVKLMAFKTLAEMRATQAEEKVTEMLFSEDEELAANAAITMSKICNKDDETGLKALLQGLGKVSFIVSFHSAETLENISGLPFVSQPRESADELENMLKK